MELENSFDKMDESESRSCSIVDLPVELILTIFNFLDNKSRLSVSATCRSWKSITENYFKWSMHLNPTFNGYVYSEMIRVRSRRQFTNIDLKGNVSVPIIVEFFTELGHAFLSTVTDLSITNTTVQVMEFNTLLAILPNLKNLHLSFVNVLTSQRNSDPHVSDQHKPLCKQLKKLSVCDHTDNRLLQCLTKSKLLTLICRQQHLTQDAVLKFLSTQIDLREIDFCRIASNTALEFGMGTSVVISSLREVALDYASISDFNGIAALLLHQANSLVTVALGHIPVLPVLTIIFKNLANLKTLHLMPGCVTDHFSNDLILQPLGSVTSLRLYDGANYGLHPISTEEMTNQIIKHLPNLEDLELLVPYKETYFQSIITHLKKLRTLTIRVTFDTNLKDLKFPPVEKLRINCFINGRHGRIHAPIVMVAKGQATEANAAVRSLTYEGFVNEEFVVSVRNTFPKLEMLEVRKDLAHECEPLSGIRWIRYREISFFAQHVRFD